MFNNKLLLSIFILCFSITLHAANLRPGNIVIGSTTGYVSAVDSETGKVRPLNVGEAVKQNTIIITGKDSRAVLLFSNGATLTLKPSSQVAIEQYLHSHKASNTPSLSNLEGEPGISKTKIRLREGNIVGSVQKLNKSAGSEFDIHSLNYVAGIRGTHWWMKLNVDHERNLVWGFGIAEGSGHVKAPTGDVVVLDEQSVINLTGKLTESDDITDAEVRSGDMPSKQFEGITSAAEQAEELFELYEIELFFKEILEMP